MVFSCMTVLVIFTISPLWETFGCSCNQFCLCAFARQLRGSLPSLSKLAPSFKATRNWSMASGVAATPTAGTGSPLSSAAAAAAAARGSRGGAPAAPAVGYASGIDRQLQQLRLQMGLPEISPSSSAATATAAAVGGRDWLISSSSSSSPLPAPEPLVQELISLGKNLLQGGGAEAPSANEGFSQGQERVVQQQAGGVSDTSTAAVAAVPAAVAGGDDSASDLPDDLLVSAARQHLMSGSVESMTMKQMQLLVGDFQHLLLRRHETAFLQR